MAPPGYAPILHLKHCTRTEVTGNGKQSRLIGYGNNYDCKKFYSAGSRGEKNTTTKIDLPKNATNYSTMRQH